MFFRYKSKKAKQFLARLFVLQGTQSRKSVTSPRLFSAKDWHYVLLETRISLKDKKMHILAAGTAFYSTLAFFPLLAAVIAVVAYVITLKDLNSALVTIEMYFPIDVAALVGTQLQRAYEFNSRNVVIAIIGFTIALISATRAMSTLISSINTAYEQKEKRKTSVVLGMSLLMAVAAIVLTALVLVLVLVDQGFLVNMGVPTFLASALPLVRWLLLTIVIAGSLALLYRIAPSNHSPHWRWVSWGAGIASVIWLAGTTLLFLYAKYVSLYSNIYNVFGSVIVLLIWFNLSAFVILLGAEINHRLEQRTTRRTSKK
jgi:membrane protein